MIPETAERGYVRLIGLAGATGNDIRPSPPGHLRVCCELAPVALWSCAAARSGAVVMLLVAVHRVVVRRILVSALDSELIHASRPSIRMYLPGSERGTSLHHRVSPVGFRWFDFFRRHRTIAAWEVPQKPL